MNRGHFIVVLNEDDYFVDGRTCLLCYQSELGGVGGGVFLCFGEMALFGSYGG